MKRNFIILFVIALLVCAGFSNRASAQSWRWYRWGKCGYAMCKDDTAGMSDRGAACTHSCHDFDACYWGWGCRGSFWPWNWGRGWRWYAYYGHEEQCCHHEGNEEGHSCNHDAKGEGHTCNHEAKTGEHSCCKKGESKEGDKEDMKCCHPHHHYYHNRYYYRGGGY